MLLYYITDRSQFAGNNHARTEALLVRVAEAAFCGIDCIQLREKDLSANELQPLAGEIIKRVREAGTNTRILINSRTDVALATGADGVHLRSKDISREDIRKIWTASGASSRPTVAVSCHSEAEVIAAQHSGADFAVFGPVFEKSGAAGSGLAALRAACHHSIPVLALGGVTVENAQACLDAGAAGVAGIRLFQAGSVQSTVHRLRAAAKMNSVL